MSDHVSKADTAYCLLYDGQCPMCAAFAEFIDTAEVGQLKKIDARQDSPLQLQATKAGFDLDYGIVIEHQGKLYYGADALTCLAKRKHKSLKLMLVYLPFRYHWLSALIYPVLVKVRRMLLWFRKTPLINNLPPR